MTQQEKTVRVKLLRGAAGPEWSARAGDVVWLEEHAAGQLVAGGFAELVEPRAVAAVIEDATTGPMLPAAAEETAVAATAERAERAVAARKREPAARKREPAARKGEPARKDEAGGMKAEKTE